MTFNPTKKLVEDIYQRKVVSIQDLGKRDHHTYYVETTHDCCLLKVYSGTISKEMIESEFVWLEALGEETNLSVQYPIKNKKGELVNSQLGEDGTLVLWTLQRWLEGRVLEEQPTPELIKALALNLATLHSHASHWNPDNALPRPVYDEEELTTSLEKLTSLFDVGLVDEEKYEIFKRVVKRIIAITNHLEKAPNQWGLIHSDIHEHNYIVHNQNISMIDFSLCGYGYYLFDLAEPLLHLSKPNRRLLLDAYKELRHLPENEVELLEAFFLWQIIRNFAFHSSNPAEYEYLKKDIPLVMEKLFEKFLRGERFLLE